MTICSSLSLRELLVAEISDTGKDVVVSSQYGNKHPFSDKAHDRLKCHNPKLGFGWTKKANL